MRLPLLKQGYLHFHPLRHFCPASPSPFSLSPKTVHSKPICQQAPPGACPIGSPETWDSTRPRFFYAYFLFTAFLPTAFQTTHPPNMALAIFAPAYAGLPRLRQTPRFFMCLFPFITLFINSPFNSFICQMRLIRICPVRAFPPTPHTNPTFLLYHFIPQILLTLTHQ